MPEPAWAIAGLAVGWGGLISQLRHHWGGESYYNFGWFVPPLAIWLLLRNLGVLDKTPKAIDASGKSSPGKDATALMVSGIILLPVLLFHAFSEVNPFWRVPLWAQGACMSGFTVVVLSRYYGWQGIRAGLFPLLFLSTMIPWPFRVEIAIVQSLTQVVVGWSLHGLHFLSYPVEMVGNTLQLGEIMIGVDEACSGIRSLQALFMVTLFLGSLFGQSAFRRILAVLLLPVIVIIVNTGRAIFLSTQVIVNGQEAYDKWHDPAGYIAFGVSMVLIYAAIELLNLGGAGSSQSQAVDFKSLAGHWEGSRPQKLTVGFLLIPAAVLLIVEGWFRVHELGTETRPFWELSLPEEGDHGFNYLEIGSRIEAALGYSFGHRFTYSLPQRGRLVDVYYYGYTEEDKLSSVSSYGHAPTICMESTGATLVEEYAPMLVEAGDMRIPFKHYLFAMPDTGMPVQIFWTVWEARNMDIDPEQLQTLDYQTQWIQLVKGRRDFRRQVLLLSILGLGEEQTAREEFEKLMKEWIIVPEY
ncbi:MAG: exosortase/archaeosortase family protein [Puniceicoccaceae bacterium]